MSLCVEMAVKLSKLFGVGRNLATGEVGSPSKRNVKAKSFCEAFSCGQDSNHPLV